MTNRRSRSADWTCACGASIHYAKYRCRKCYSREFRRSRCHRDRIRKSLRFHASKLYHALRARARKNGWPHLEKWEFDRWLYEDDMLAKFKTMRATWFRSGDHADAPSIDRIRTMDGQGNPLGYQIGNINLLTHSQNAQKRFTTDIPLEHEIQKRLRSEQRHRHRLPQALHPGGQPVQTSLLQAECLFYWPESLPIFQRD